ncbi:MAG: arylesterase [Rhodothalassiaceae bacterium]
MGFLYAFKAYGLRGARIKQAIGAAFLLALVLAAANIAGAMAREVTVLAFGDSLTAGYGLAQDRSFPAQLETALKARLGAGVRVVNAGVSGDTSAGGRARLDWVLSAIEGGAPDLVIVELGANDALRGIDPALTRANLAAILEELHQRGIPVLLAGMRAPPNMGADYGRAFDSIYPALAREYGVAAFYPFFLDGVAARPELNQADGIHPTGEGVAIIVDRILPHVLAALGRESGAGASRELGQ